MLFSLCPPKFYFRSLFQKQPHRRHVHITKALHLFPFRESMPGLMKRASSAARALPMADSTLPEAELLQPADAPPSVGPPAEDGVTADEPSQSDRATRSHSRKSGSKRTANPLSTPAPQTHKQNSPKKRQQQRHEATELRPQTPPAEELAGPQSKRARVVHEQPTGALRRFAIIADDTGRSVHPPAVTVCGSSGHPFASQDVERYWPYASAYLRLVDMSNASIAEFRSKILPHERAARIELVSTTDPEDGAPRLVRPLSAMIRHGECPPELLCMPELANYKIHVLCIARMYGSSLQELAELADELSSKVN